MLRSKFLIFLLLAAGCSQAQKDKMTTKLVTGNWLKKQAMLALPERLPASTSSGQVSPPTCFRDLYNVENIKREALQLESQVNSGRKISGSWKHLNLANLPIPQANFLKDLGDNLGDINNPNGISYSQCQDAICVINTVYQSNDGLEGWVTYLWYLKMGNIISFKNKIYSQNNPRGGIYNGQNYDLKDYLFSRDELQSFWLITHALTSPFQRIAGLKEVQRIPGKSTIEGRSSGDGALSFPDGYLVFTNGSFINASIKEDRSFSMIITHELAHQIDVKLGKENGVPGGYASTNGWWKQEHGWTANEYRDEQNNTIKTTWSTSMPDSQFVRDYARTNPIEHFADTLSYYRFESTITKEKISAKTYNYIRDYFFENQEYYTSNQLEKIKKDASLKLSIQISNIVASCKQDSSINENIAPTKPKKPAPNPKRKPQSIEELSPCLEKKVDSLIEQSIAEVKLNDINGCTYFESNAKTALLKNDIKRVLSDQIVEYTNTVKKNPNHQKDIDTFTNALNDRMVPIQAMTDCYDSKDGNNEKACYENQLREDASKAAIENFEKTYLEMNRYEKVQAESQKLYQDFVFSQSALLLSSASDLWKNCLNVKIDNSATPVSGPFSVGQKWMVSSQFNCLNNDISSQVNHLITEMNFDSEKVTDEKESAILYDVTLPLFVKEITRLYQKDVDDEEVKIILAKYNLKKVQTERLSQSFAWAKKIGKKTNMKQACRDEIMRDLPQDLHYHDISTTFDGYIQEVCTAVAKSTAYTKWAKKNGKK